MQKSWMLKALGPPKYCGTKRLARDGRSRGLGVEVLGGRDWCNKQKTHHHRNSTVQAPIHFLTQWSKPTKSFRDRFDWPTPLDSFSNYSDLTTESESGSGSFKATWIKTVSETVTYQTWTKKFLVFIMPQDFHLNVPVGQDPWTCSSILPSPQHSLIPEGGCRARDQEEAVWLPSRPREDNGLCLGEWNSDSLEKTVDFVWVSRIQIQTAWLKRFDSRRRISYFFFDLFYVKLSLKR